VVAEKQATDRTLTEIQADIDRKIAGKEIASAPAPSEGGRVIDLMEALKASLGEGRQPAKAASESAEATPISSLAKAPQADGALGRKPARRATPSTASDAVLVAKSETRKRVSKR